MINILLLHDKDIVVCNYTFLLCKNYEDIKYCKVSIINSFSYKRIICIIALSSFSREFLSCSYNRKKEKILIKYCFTSNHNIWS